MYASVVRFSAAALARQPAATAGLKTSAVTSMAASKVIRNEDGRMTSRNRRQVFYDPAAPLPAEKETNWANVASRIRDAKDLAGC